MPRRASHKISNKTARAKLPVRTSPYFDQISEGFHLGWYRTSNGTGRWVARRKLDGKYVSERIGDADDQHLANGKTVLTYQQAVTLAQQVFKLVGTTEISVAQAAAEWVEAKNQGVTSKATLSNNRTAANRISNAFEEKTLRNLTAADIERWRDSFTAGLNLIAADDDDAYAESLRKRRATANRALATLKAMLNRAAKLHQFAGARVWGDVKKFKRAEAFGARMRVLTEDEELALLASSPCPHFADLLQAGFLTGARYGELCSMRVRDFYGRKLRLDGKTGERIIDLGDRQVEFFTNLTSGANAPKRHILLKADGSAWGDGHQRNMMGDTAKKSGLFDVVFYDIRHTLISRWVSQGVPIAAVAKHCGTSADMIEQTYAKFSAGQNAGWFG